MILFLRRLAYLGALSGSFPVFSSPAYSAAPQQSFLIRPVSLTATDDIFGPQLGSGVRFSGYNGDPAVGSTGEVGYPGNLFPNPSGYVEGFWLNRNGQNSAVALAHTDGALGPGFGAGIVFNNMFHGALPGAPGHVLLGGFLDGSGVNDSNNEAYIHHAPAGNMPVARSGVSSQLGPGLGDDMTFKFLYSAQINTTNDILLRASIAGPGVTPATADGLWQNTPAGNVPVVRSGVDGALGPGLGPGIVFEGGAAARIAESSDDFLFVGRTLNSATLDRGIGLWKHAGGGNGPIALSGVDNNLGPGLGPNVAFGAPSQIPFETMEFDASDEGGVAFFSTLADGRRGVWRNLGQDNEPLMLVGETGVLGPGLGIQDTFAHFTPSILLPEPAISDTSAVLFPGLLESSRKQGMWLNAGDGNQVIALTGDDGELGPGLGSGVTFTGFNRAYFGADDIVYFTADLSLNVPFNRLLGLWAYRDGRIEPIVVYNELFDVDPTVAVDERRVRWVQIPSDVTTNNDYSVDDSGQLVFRIGFQDGTGGIFRAALIPEPAAGPIIAAASLLWLLSTRSRRRIESV